MSNTVVSSTAEEVQPLSSGTGDKLVDVSVLEVRD